MTYSELITDKTFDEAVSDAVAGLNGHKDWLGVDIEVGSRVVYSFNTSTSVTHMAEGTVERFPPLEGRERLPRAEVRILRSTLDSWPAHWNAVQKVKVKILTVIPQPAFAAG